MSNQKQASINNNQQGLVAILITMILMIVITLIVLSFAAISRKEQRNALDRQLSTQAFYASESGINDARKVIESWLANPIAAAAALNVDYMTTCNQFAAASTVVAATLPPGSPTVSIPGMLGGSGAASYTCLLVDPSPPSIEYSKSDAQHVLPIKAQGGVAIGSIDVEWDDGGSGTNFGGCPVPPSNPPGPLVNCSAPVLRLELVDGTNLTPPPLPAPSPDKVFFIYPSASLGSINYGTDTTGKTVQAKCVVPIVAPQSKKCKVTITLGGTEYYMRIKSIYGPAALTIKAYDSSGAPIGWVGAQAIIDSTGKATDVERRIQVRVQANNLSGNVPEYGLEGTDKICKKFSIDGTNVDGGPCFPLNSPN